eukprot:2375184-Amphidinium_carterae.1
MLLWSCSHITTAATSVSMSARSIDKGCSQVHLPTATITTYAPKISKAEGPNISRPTLGMRLPRKILCKTTIVTHSFKHTCDNALSATALCMALSIMLIFGLHKKLVQDASMP